MVQSVLIDEVAVPKHSATKLTYDDYVLIPDDGRTGVRDYWVIDPSDERVTMYRNDGRKFGEPVRLTRTGSLTTPLLPGVNLPLEPLVTEP